MRGAAVRVDRLRQLAARLTVMPSRFETFGIVAVESHAVGTPVLAFDIDCLREVVPEGTGLLVPAFDVAASAESLVELSADADRSVGGRGRRGRRSPAVSTGTWWPTATGVGARRRRPGGHRPVPGDSTDACRTHDLEKEMT